MAELRAAGQTGLLNNTLNREQLMHGPGRAHPTEGTDDERRHRRRTTAATARSADGAPADRVPKGSTVVKWITTTDHKVIGNLYFITSFVWFMLAGIMALLIRAELVSPGLQVVDNPEQYNQLFTMHGTIMLLLFATPLFAGFANALMPLQIGAPDVAFPRLNMFAYWLYLFGGAHRRRRASSPRSGAASFGWFAYAPLSDNSYSPGLGGDLWVFGLALAGFGTILGAVNFITTIICMRAPGMTMFRMPIFTWTVLDHLDPRAHRLPGRWPPRCFALGADRRFGAHVFDPENGGPMLWQHLFWFFGHPEVYVIALPFFGIISEVLPVFSRKPIFGYKTLVFATIAIAALSVSVWAHHMYVDRPGAAAVLRDHDDADRRADRGEVLQLDRHDVGRASSPSTPRCCGRSGFLVTFLFGGLTGVILASPALDFQLSDSYFVVAHFHYVVFGTVVFAMFAGFYFWWPKFTGRMLDERLGKIHFWLLFIGFHTTFLIQHLLGMQGMPRRYADYLPEDGFTLGEPASPRSARSSSARRCCRSSTTSGRRGAPRRSSRPTTRGATAPRSSGRRPARRRGTTSTASRGSAPSDRRSTCTTPRTVDRRRCTDAQWADGKTIGLGCWARHDLEGNAFVDENGQGGLTRCGPWSAIGILVGGLRLHDGDDLRVLDGVDRDRHRVGRRHRPDPRRPARLHDRLVPLDDAAPARARPVRRPAG